MKRKLPEPAFYTLADLAMLWGYHPDRLRVYAEHGTEDGRKLEIVERPIDGKPAQVVTREERQRFESGRNAKKPDALNSSERNSLLSLVGVFAVGWSGEDPEYLWHPYKLHRNLAEWAARAGVPMVRGDDTYARLIKEALALVASEGYKPARPEQDPGDEREAA